MPADTPAIAPSWNPLHDLGQLLEYHFMVNALLAGSAAAVIAGLAGWMMVLRRETFAGHTLAVMAFPGASAAALAGVPAAWGYLAFCGAGALTIGRLPAGDQSAARHDAAGVGVVQASALALGFLFVSLYGGVLGDLETLLFGNLLGVSDTQVLTLAAVAVAVVVALAAIGRPLLLASLAPDLARSRGVPVARLGTAFLLLLALAVAATCAVMGPLLVFSLLLMPPAAAQALSRRPGVSVALSVALGLLAAWLGLALAYYSVYPPGFFISLVAFACYLLARAVAALTAVRARRAGTLARREPLASRGAADAGA